MGATIDEMLEKLTCPICYLHPEKEVFQCLNGHPICSTCIIPLVNCPLCRIPFGVPRSRCRLMESLLDSVELPCANKDAGCTQQFLRTDLPDHYKFCEFRSVSLCKWMGYQCDFAASKAGPLLEHLASCHNAKVCSGNVCQIFQPSHQLYLQEVAGNSPNSEKTWILVHATLEAGPNHQQFFSCVPIYIQDGHNCTGQLEVQFELFYQQEQKVEGYEFVTRFLLKWTGFPSKFKDAEVDIKHPSCRLTTDYIAKQILKFGKPVDFDLGLNFSVAVKPVMSL